MPADGRVDGRQPGWSRCRAAGRQSLPVAGTGPIEDTAIVIHEGRIVAVGPRSKVSLPRDAETIDCTGLVVTAGFWNSHVHILTPGLLDARASGVEPLQKDLDTMFNRWGFTTVFDLGSALDNTLALRRRIESGDVTGPRILTTGEPIWTIEPVYVRDFLSLHHIDTWMLILSFSALTRHAMCERFPECGSRFAADM